MWKLFLIHESYCSFRLNESFDKNYIWNKYMNLADVVCQMKVVIIRENSFKFMIHTVSSAIEWQLICSLKGLFRFKKLTFERIILLVCFSTFSIFQIMLKIIYSTMKIKMRMKMIKRLQMKVNKWIVDK